MSTNPKELNPLEASKTMIEKSKRSTDRTLRALNQEMEQENTLVQDTPNTRLQKVLKIYRGIKPVLAVLGSLQHVQRLKQLWQERMGENEARVGDVDRLAADLFFVACHAERRAASRLAGARGRVVEARR